MKYIYHRNETNTKEQPIKKDNTQNYTVLKITLFRQKKLNNNTYNINT